MKLIATFITVFLAVILAKSDEEVSTSNDCSAQLIIEKDRSSKSADEEGAQFILVLTNTSRDSKSYTLSSKHLSTPCNSNTQYNRGTGAKNVELDVSFQTNGLNRNASNNLNANNIVLNSGESYRFIVNVNVPKGTKFNTWSCIEVEVKSKDCDFALDSKTLSVFVADPSEG